jgi:hypothetical protein
VTFHKSPPDRFCVDRCSAATRLQQTDTARDISVAMAACRSLSQFSHWQYPPPLKFGTSLGEFRVKSLELDLGLGLAEIAGAPIPGYGCGGVAPCTTQAAEAEKGGVERHSQLQRSFPVSDIGGAFVEQARRGDIAGAQQLIPSRDQSRYFRR